MRAGIVLQARMASQRLPRKAMAVLAGRPLVEQCLRRLLHGGAAPVILATTTHAEDDVLAGVAEALGVPVCRGSATDVLGRYVACARAFELDVVIRATADNPGVDLDAPDRLLRALVAGAVDYVREEDLPYGGAVEAVTSAALARAADLTDDAADHEHVTPFVRRRPDLFACLELRAPAPLARPDVRVTVDTWTDLQRMRGLYALAALDLPPLHALIDGWDRTMRSAA